MAAETYRSQDIRRLFKNKMVVVIGSSVMRSVYKDLVLFLQSDNYLTEKDLRAKGEKSCNGDLMYEGGKQHNNTHYREVRQYLSNDGIYCIRFYFITKIYNPYFETILEDLGKDPRPDVVIMNSCLWDMSRYGPWWLKRYKTNLDVSLTKLKNTLPEQCLSIWTTCTPVGNTARGGVFQKNIMWTRDTLRLDVLEGNFYSKQAAVEHGMDVLDLHFYMRRLINLRAADEIHWNAIAHRKITNLVLLHFCDALGIPKPRFMKPLPMRKLQPHPMRGGQGIPPMISASCHVFRSEPMEIDCNNNFADDEVLDEVDSGFCEDFENGPSNFGSYDNGSPNFNAFDKGHPHFNAFSGNGQNLDTFSDVNSFANFRDWQPKRSLGNYLEDQKYGGPVNSMSSPNLHYQPYSLNSHAPLNHSQSWRTSQQRPVSSYSQYNGAPSFGSGYQNLTHQNAMTNRGVGGFGQVHRGGPGYFW